MILESRKQIDGDLGKAETLQEAILAWQMDLIDELISGKWELASDVPSPFSKHDIPDVQNPLLDYTTNGSQISGLRNIRFENMLISWDLSRFKIDAPILELSDEHKKFMDDFLSRDITGKDSEKVYEKLWVYSDFEKYSYMEDWRKELMTKNVSFSFLKVDWNYRIFVYYKSHDSKLIFRIDVNDLWEVVKYDKAEWASRALTQNMIRLLEGIPFFKDLKENYNI